MRFKSSSYNTVTVVNQNGYKVILDKISNEATILSANSELILIFGPRHLRRRRRRHRRRRRRRCLRCRILPRLAIY